MRFAELVDTSIAVGQSAGRLDKTDRLARLLARLDPGEIEIAVAFLSGSPRQGRLGIGWSMVTRVREVPPVADAALSLREVDAAFDKIAGISGAGSTAARADVLTSLYRRATTIEQQFVTRLIFGELNQGALEGVLLEAVARAAKIPARVVRRTATVAGALGPVARAALTEGEKGLARFGVELFRPVRPMLADSADAIEEALEELGDAAIEAKLDGARVQVHKAGDEVRVFSRASNDVTDAVPEVVEIVRAWPARDIILDGEVLALRADGSPHPFQTTMRRFGRRLDVGLLRAELPLSPVFFDSLYVDGESLLDKPQRERFPLVTAGGPNLVVPYLTSPTESQAVDFLHRIVGQGHEGLMAKALTAPYQGGSRGRAWLKVKRAHTLDLVVLAAEWGHGRRKGLLSNLHLGARDPERNAFVMLGKTFKGLTDQMLTWQTDRLLALEIGRDAQVVHVRPELVAEIAFNDVQESPQYPGRLALRFARVKRYRDDKPAAEADTFESVQRIFRRSTGKEPPARR